MTKQTASCTIIKYQDNHPRKHEHSFACSLIYLSLVVNDETRFSMFKIMKSVQTMDFIICVYTGEKKKMENMLLYHCWKLPALVWINIRTRTNYTSKCGMETSWEQTSSVFYF